ncbi:unnamed protein product [Oppiella nova]|uniref:Uncharacterized protein n=1 Tax=Oppiella nova TaxID=334625 RepID=A0A7R9MDS5_9ACAR|nr:unnamed protein product [Oppiella nova]CAG2175498.1 unnamed protein product [Oppiella nova]
MVIVQLIHRHLYLKLKTKRVLSLDLRELANGLQKIPKHIAVCVNEHHFSGLPSVDPLIRCLSYVVITSCVLLSTLQYIRVFESIGGPVREVCDEWTQSHGCDGAHNNGFAKTRVNGKTSGGVMTMNGLSVCVVSYKHSIRQSIVKAAQHLSRQKAPIDQNQITI